MKKQGIMFWVIVLLVAIGIIDSLFVSHHIPLSSILVPVAVIGIVFLLYKFRRGNTERLSRKSNLRRARWPKSPRNASLSGTRNAKRIRFRSSKDKKAKTTTICLNIIK
ncbi:hypothetical protein HMSSN139_04800 [Paenibacillus sp. HMSSN-139]|nr:hypothetical protein HMSSN139_04800 [Paenibacillus sp. HMSSN-139]